MAKTQGIVSSLTPVAADDRIDLLMQPAGFRILVQILPPDESLKRWQDSNLVMPAEVRDREWGAQLWAKVLKLGPQAYRDRRRFGLWRRAWCKPGDCIMMRQYSGTRFMVRGNLYALINDDTVQAVLGEDEVKVLERP